MAKFKSGDVLRDAHSDGENVYTIVEVTPTHYRIKYQGHRSSYNFLTHDFIEDDMKAELINPPAEAVEFVLTGLHDFTKTFTNEGEAKAAAATLRDYLKDGYAARQVKLERVPVVTREIVEF
jgi:hypothetical protein